MELFSLKVSQETLLRAGVQDQVPFTAQGWLIIDEPPGGICQVTSAQIVVKWGVTLVLQEIADW